MDVNCSFQSAGLNLLEIFHEYQQVGGRNLQRDRAAGLGLLAEMEGFVGKRWVWFVGFAEGAGGGKTGDLRGQDLEIVFATFLRMKCNAGSGEEQVSRFVRFEVMPPDVELEGRREIKGRLPRAI